MEVDITKFRVYLMAFWCIFFMRLLMFGFGMFKFASLLMECSYIAPLTPAVMVMRGLIFHPLFGMTLIVGSYLV
jgi:hypothetical protein